MFRVDALLERDRQRVRAVVGALRRHVHHVLDAVDLLLDRRRHRVGARPARWRRDSSAETSTVGGVISGYCAIGSVNSATAPASVITIDSTEAKIGRSMKNLRKQGRLTSLGVPVDLASWTAAVLRRRGCRRVGRQLSVCRPARDRRQAHGTWSMNAVTMAPSRTSPVALARRTAIAGLQAEAGPRPIIASATAIALRSHATPNSRASPSQSMLKEEYRGQEHAEQRHAEHAAEHGDAQRLTHFGAGAVRAGSAARRRE